jgi:hypothetical protein
LPRQNIEPRLREARNSSSELSPTPARHISPTELCEILEPCCRLLSAGQSVRYGPVAKEHDHLAMSSRLQRKKRTWLLHIATKSLSKWIYGGSCSELNSRAYRVWALLINWLLPCKMMCTNGAPSSISALIVCPRYHNTSSSRQQIVGMF